jgi:hypothetical protein
MHLSFTWLGDAADVWAAVGCCDCKQAKEARQWQIGPPGHLPLQRPFTTIYVDWVGPFKPEYSRSGEDVLHVCHVRDHLWGYSRLKAAKEKSARVAAGFIIKRVYQQEGMLPKVVQSDEYKSLAAGKTFQACFGAALQATCYAAAPYYPQYQTVIERPHSLIKLMLIMAVLEGVKLEDAVGSVEQALNAMPSPAHGYMSQFALKYGYDNVNVFDRLLEVDTKDPQYEFVANKM